jgi:hypothetical protein
MVEALTRFASSTWVRWVVALGSDPYRNRRVPDGSVQLICHVGSPPLIIGPLTQPRVTVLAPGSTVVGVRFRLGAAASALGVPASALTDLVVEADAVLGRSVVSAGEQIAEASSFSDMTAVLQRFLKRPFCSSRVRRMVIFSSS